MLRKVSAICRTQCDRPTDATNDALLEQLNTAKSGAYHYDRRPSLVLAALVGRWSNLGAIPRTRCIICLQTVPLPITHNRRSPVPCAPQQCAAAPHAPFDPPHYCPFFPGLADPTVCNLTQTPPIRSTPSSHRRRPWAWRPETCPAHTSNLC